MRVAELLRFDDWRVWTVFDTPITPEGDPTVVRYVALDAGDDDPAPFDRWDDATQAFVADGWTPPAPPAPAPPTVMSRLAFQSRYTVAEQVAIELAADGTTVGYTPEQRATLRVLDRALQNATEINLTDPRTVQGVQAHATMLLITAARATQILDPQWTPTA